MRGGDIGRVVFELDATAFKVCKAVVDRWAAGKALTVVVCRGILPVDPELEL